MSADGDRCERIEVRVARLEERGKAAEAARVQAKVELDIHMRELNDIRIRFLDKHLYEREHDDLKNRVSDLEKSKFGAQATLAAYGSTIAFLLALLALWAALRH